jgi:hypothetical protein
MSKVILTKDAFACKRKVLTPIYSVKYLLQPRTQWGLFQKSTYGSYFALDPELGETSTGSRNFIP